MCMRRWSRFDGGGDFTDERPVGGGVATDLVGSVDDMLLLAE